MVRRMSRRVGGRGRAQVRKRADASRKLVDDEIATLQKVVDEVLDIAPVKATLDLVVGSIDNVSKFIKKQADLTRERIR